MAIFKTCSKSSGTNDFWDFPKSMKIDEKSLENSDLYNGILVQIADFPDTVMGAGVKYVDMCVRYRCITHVMRASHASRT